MNRILLLQSDFLDISRVRLTGRRFVHISTMHKPAIGQSLRVGVVNGRMGRGNVVSMSDTSIEMTIQLDSDPPPPLPATVLLALPRPKSLRKALFGMTSMGVKNIFIMESWRVEKSYWGSPMLTEESLHEIMILALEQAQDTVVPQLSMKKKFRPFVEDEVPGIARGTRALVAHPEAQTPCPRGIDAPVTLALGPERGFTPFETGLFEKAGFDPVSLGERILRVEDAVVAALGRLC